MREPVRERYFDAPSTSGSRQRFCFRIEHGIPIPPRRNVGSQGKRWGYWYPWARMKAGDSFLIPDYTHPKALSARSSGVAWCKGHAPRLTCVIRKEGNSVRVWLVERH